jgi:hypothetical protein
MREGKNLTLKNGGVDGCDCEETLKLIAEGKLDIEPLIILPIRSQRSTRRMSCLKINTTELL